MWAAIGVTAVLWWASVYTFGDWMDPPGNYIAGTLVIGFVYAWLGMLVWFLV